MARYDPSLTVKEALASFLDNPVFNEATGAIKINSMDKKRFGTVFLYRGKVYAVQVKGYPVRLYTRLINCGLLDELAIDDLTRKYHRDQESTTVIDYAAQKMMIDADQAGSFIREHTMGAWDDVFSWRGVKVEWKDGANTDILAFRNRPVSLEKLVELGEKRADYLDEIADRYTVKPEDLETLKYRLVGEASPDARGIDAAVAQYGNGDYSVRDLNRLTGIPTFNLISIIFEMWEEDRVEVWYEGFPITHQAVQQMHTDLDSYGEAQPLVGSQMITPVDENPQLDEEHELSEEDEEDLDFVDAIEEVKLEDPQDESGELQLTQEVEEDMTNEYAEPDEDFIPLNLDEEEEESAETPAPATGAVAVVARQAAPAEPVAAPAVTEHEDFASSFAAFIQQAREQLAALRDTLTDSAAQMRACDDVVATENANIAAHRAAIEEAEQAIVETQATRQEWEAVYDAAEAQYKGIQAHLDSLREIG